MEDITRILLQFALVFLFQAPALAQPVGPPVHLGKGCITAYFIDQDCDGYGVGVRADGNYTTGENRSGRLGDRPDADDNDPQVNTPQSMLAKYGTLRNFLSAVKGHTAGDIYYIDSNGNDAGTGGIDHPFKTFGRVDDLLGPGDVLVYRGGTYYADTHGAISGLYTPFSGGSPGSPVLIISYPGERVILDAVNTYISTLGGLQWITFDGFIVENSRNRPWGYGINLSEAKNTVFRNSEITNFNWPASMQDQDRLLVEGNIFHDMLEHGFYLGARDLPGKDITIKGNVFYRNGRGGFYGAIQYNGRVANLVIENNIVHSNYQWGVSFKQGVCNSIVRNNLIFNNLGYPIMFALYPGDGVTILPYNQTGNLIVNNTIWAGRFDFNGQIPENSLPTGVSVVAFAYDSGVEDGHSQEHNVFRNNILVNYSAPTFDFRDRNAPFAATTTIEHNLMYKLSSSTNVLRVGAQTYDFVAFEAFSNLISNNAFGDPKFEDVSTAYYATPDKFCLDLMADSPAINLGRSFAGAPVSDLRGSQRSGAPDAGCYEFSSSGSTPPGAPRNLRLAGN